MKKQAIFIMSFFYLFLIGFSISNIIAGEYAPDANTVALWHLNGDWQDASQNRHNLTVSGNPEFVAGCPYVQGSTKALHPHAYFSVSNPDLIYTNDIKYPGSGGWTVECWVKFDHLYKNHPEKRGWMIQQYTEGVAGHEPFLLGITEDSLFFQIQSSSNEAMSVTADANSYVGKWIHVAGVYDPGSIKLYVNRTLVGETSGNVVPESMNAPTFICSQWDFDHGHSYDFYIDEVRISDKARDPSEFDIGNNNYQAKRLTTSPNREGWYGWSPDGKSLAYIEAVTPNDNRSNLLKVINTDGSNERTLYQGVGIGYGYAVDWVDNYICFIPDHRYQANPDYYEKGDGDVHWIKEDGSGLKRLTNTTCGAANGIHNVSWGNSSDSVGTVSDVIRLTPDASQIAFIAHNGNGWYAPYIGDINNWDHVLYVNSSGHLNGLYLSRDGSFLLYERAVDWDQPHDIHKINIGGTNDVTLVTNLQVNEGLEFAISPDMSRFVYTSNQEGQRDISVMNIDGTNNTTLVATDKDEFFSHLTDRSYSRRDPKGIWSPDGQKIVFTRLDADGKGDIYMLNLQTMQETQLTTDPANDFDPSFSPDGKKIAFISDRSGSQDIWIIDMSQTGIEETKSLSSIPKSFSLKQNYPNPFNPSTTISYDLPEKSRIRIDIFNLLGTHIRTLTNCLKASGHYSIMWDGLNDQHQSVPSGIYIYRLKAGNSVVSRKMLLVR